MSFLSSFEKHRFKSHTKVNLMIKLSISVYLSTISPLPIYLKNLITASNHSIYTESSPFYYILFTMTCMSIVPHPVIQLLKIAYQHLKRKIIIRYFIKNQDDLNQAFIPSKYSYQDGYADHLVCIMLGVSFSVFFPIALYVVMVGIFVSYFIDKYNSMLFFIL